MSGFRGTLLAATLFSVTVTAHAAPSLTELRSPDGRNRIVLQSAGDDGYVRYRVERDGRRIIRPSIIGPVLAGGGALGKGARIVDVRLGDINEQFKLRWSKTSEVTNHCSYAVATLATPANMKWEVELRAYDDGVAFRYRLPRQDGLDDFELRDEVTQFDVEGNPRALFNTLGNFTTSHESLYERQELSAIPSRKLIDMPMLLTWDGGHAAAITEARVLNFAGAYLERPSVQATTLRCRLSPLPSRDGVCVAAKTPHESPWRRTTNDNHPTTPNRETRPMCLTNRLQQSSKRRLRPIAVLVLLTTLSSVPPLAAGTLQVPQHHETIQAAIDAAKAGDTVLVAAGTYKERVRLKHGVTLKSVGDNAKGELGLKRAEATIIDGNVEGASGAGVMMAEDSILDGFTVTGVGKYDDELWKKHHATQGEEQPHEHIGAPGTAGIAVIGIERCAVTNNIVHHVGYTGIAITGAEGKRVSPHIFRNVTYRNMGGGIGSMKKSIAIIEGNVCFENYYAGIGHDEASPLVINNVCYANVRAGIGVSEGSCPVVRDNKCYKNRRAGIGIRTGEETQPIVEHNECYENDMAGIGNRDDARPIIRHNRCYKNRMAGIGSRDGARAVIEHNECYENQMAGIGSRLGAAPVIRNNRCYRNRMAGIGAREKARPVIEDNECFENQMAGIGTQQDAAAIVRNNRCYRNEMAGIGSRLGALPVIVENECFENKMAGIGSREGAAPVIRNNLSHHNQMAGIGNRRGARSVVVDNVSRENQMAGVGVRDKETVAVIIGNRCLENRLVAVGLPDGATGYIHGNELKRTGGGAPPLVAVKGGSRGIVSHNSITGGGVAGVLAHGDVSIFGNHFQGAGGRQGSAVWVWKDSTVNVASNRFAGYRNAVNASGSKVTATDNVTRHFSGPSMIVKKPSSPARVYGNTAISANPKDPAVDVDGGDPTSDDNVRKEPDEVDESKYAAPQVWPLLSRDSNGDSFHTLANTNRQLVVQEGPWKLVATYGKMTTYALFNTASDPQEKTDLSVRLEQITFRLRGLLEKQEGLNYQAEMRGKGTGR